MSDKLNQAKSIRNLASLYRDMEGAASALEKIGSLEQAETEAKTRVDALRAEAESVVAELESLKASVTKTKAQAQTIISNAKDAAHVATESAKHAAEVNAAEIIKKAQDEGAELIEKTVTEKARLSSEIGGLQSAVESAKTELQVVKDAREKEEVAVAAAEKRLADIKAKLAAI